MFRPIVTNGMTHRPFGGEGVVDFFKSLMYHNDMKLKLSDEQQDEAKTIEILI